ncbi:MAG: DNA transporter [Thermoprotei archaeon]
MSTLGKRIYIGIAGISEEPNGRILNNINEFIEEIGKLEIEPVFILGGYWGFMKYFADKAIEKGYTVVFILPSEPPALPPNKSNTVIIHTDLGFPTRSTIMCKSSDILVVFGGRIGSIVEAFLAYDFGKPVIVIESGYETDKIPKCFGKYIDARQKAPLYSVRNGAEAAKLIPELVREYVREYTA